MGKRLRAALHAIRPNLMRHLHRHPSDIGRWLQRVVRAYLTYHAVPGDYERLASFALRKSISGCACWGA